MPLAAEHRHKAVLPLTVDIRDAAASEDDYAFALSGGGERVKIEAGPLPKRLLGLLGRLYTLGAIENLCRLGGQGRHILLPEQPWRHERPARADSAAANTSKAEPGKPPIKLYELQWNRTPLTSLEPDKNCLCDENGEDSVDGFPGGAGAAPLIFARPALKERLEPRGFGRRGIWVTCGDRYQNPGDGRNVTVNPAEPDHFCRLLSDYPSRDILYLLGLSMDAGQGLPMQSLIEPLLNLIRAMTTKKNRRRDNLSRYRRLPGGKRHPRASAGAGGVMGVVPHVAAGAS
ncbi:hypothetical protein ABK905_13760 [Acerihabitans sp. KWT182]|uniref:Uncharacterized protein n=1 Tax=Acerihabitans sp. KWT182 TaxID=3157919 RepID=A0AAU7Q4X1_9GAMM